MSGRLPRLSGVVAMVDTADQGYFFGGTLVTAEAALAILVPVVNQTRQFQFVLPWRQIVRNIRTEITTGGGVGKFFGVGLYDAAKKKLLETGALDANATGVLTTAITAVIVEPGVYHYAWTSDSTTTAARSLNIGGSIGLILDTRMGPAANDSAAGVLPATLGALSAIGVLPPAVLFLP